MSYIRSWVNLGEGKQYEKKSLAPKAKPSGEVMNDRGEQQGA